MDPRREHVPFDPRHFEKRAARGERYEAREVFRRIYQTNHWAGPESPSGAGAGADQTHVLRAELPALLQWLHVDVLLDLPCGDFSWMQSVDLPVSQYLGGDIVPELVARNRECYGRADRTFLLLDLTDDPLPAADLLLCRDALVHLSFADIYRALANLRQSRIPYLLTTTFPACKENEDITTGDWRLLNLQAPPFDFPEPLLLLNEACSEGGGRFRDKSLGLWRVTDLPALRDAPAVQP